MGGSLARGAPFRGGAAVGAQQTGRNERRRSPAAKAVPLLTPARAPPCTRGQKREHGRPAPPSDAASASARRARSSSSGHRNVNGRNTTTARAPHTRFSRFSRATGAAFLSTDLDLGLVVERDELEVKVLLLGRGRLVRRGLARRRAARGRRGHRHRRRHHHAAAAAARDLGVREAEPVLEHLRQLRELHHVEIAQLVAQLDELRGRVDLAARAVLSSRGRARCRRTSRPKRRRGAEVVANRAAGSGRAHVGEMPHHAESAAAGRWA